jgi:hypothetical protein
VFEDQYGGLIDMIMRSTRKRLQPVGYPKDKLPETVGSEEQKRLVEEITKIRQQILDFIKILDTM